MRKPGGYAVLSDEGGGVKEFDTFTCSNRRKLSASIEQEIVSLYKQGLGRRKLGHQFNVSPATILRVLNDHNIPRRPTGLPRKYSLKEDIFSKQSADVNYWTGFMMADGCISHKNRISLALSVKDIEHLYKFKEFLGSSRPIKIQHKVPRKTFALSIDSATIKKDLESLGVMPRKTFIAQAKPKLKTDRDFWRGAIDGDGSVGIFSNRPHLNLYGSKLLCEQFADFINSTCGANVSARPTRNIWCVQLTSGTAVKATNILYGNNPTTYLDRKYKAAKEVIEK